MKLSAWVHQIIVDGHSQTELEDLVISFNQLFDHGFCVRVIRTTEVGRVVLRETATTSQRTFFIVRVYATRCKACHVNAVRDVNHVDRTKNIRLRDFVLVCLAPVEVGSANS